MLKFAGRTVGTKNKLIRHFHLFKARIAQRQSARITHGRSLVQIQVRAPSQTRPQRENLCDELVAFGATQHLAFNRLRFKNGSD